MLFLLLESILLFIQSALIVHLLRAKHAEESSESEAVLVP